MGLLGFLKKKGSDLPMANQPRANEMKLSDLPPIDPASVDSSLMERLPTPYDSTNDKGQRSMSVNLPTLDFSMPPPDDLPEGSVIDENHGPFQAQPKSKEELEPLPKLDISGIQGSPQGSPNGLGNALDASDLNKLFIGDNWKEPDWEHYDPYKVEKIEEPAPGDFVGEELPAFDDAALNAAPISGLEEDSGKDDFSESTSIPDKNLEERDKTSFDRQDSAVKPIELYIRGKAYGKVFSELDQMRKSLTKLDTLTENYEDMLKQEEPLMTSAKEQMEYAYRRLSQIDKKIFAQ